MPSTQINPFNYNIDNFDSGFLGPISDTNFRNFLFTHSLSSVNPIVGGVLGGNPWADRGTEYDVTQSTFNVVDVPNLSDVASQPSVYNNLTEPRKDNLTSNLQRVNQQLVDNVGLSNNPDQEGRNVDASSLINQTSSIIDVPGVTEVSNTSSVYNNFTQPKQQNLEKNPTKTELQDWYPYKDYINLLNKEYDTYNTEWGVPTTLRLANVGNVDQWVDGGFVTTVSDVRDFGYFTQNNIYGPSQTIQYSTSQNIIEKGLSVVIPQDEVVNGSTGFKEYNTKVRGDFRDALLSRSLGVGIIPFSNVSSGINYEPTEGDGPSDLDKIARKRRSEELKNRIKLNFVDDTLGIINTNVFGLLAGGSLLNRDFTITRPKSTLGKVADFVANLTGFNYPKSILQDGDLPFTWSSPKQQLPNPIKPNNIDEVDISQGLLDRTGKATREVIIDTTELNKYGPNFGGKYSEYNGGTYLSPDTNVIKKQNEKLGPTPKSDGNIDGDTQEGGFYGRNETPTKTSFSETAGFDSPENNPDIQKPGNFIWTVDYDQQVNQGDVKLSKTPFRKGLLKYTQDIVNKSNADLNKLGGYIGYFDSQKSKNNDNKHITGTNSVGEKPTLPSKGNQVRNISVTKNGDTIGGDIYCRSWSSTSRFGKNNYNDLVRSGGNWWLNVQESDKFVKDGNSLLTMNYGKNPSGIPKMAWSSGDAQRFKDAIGAESKTKGLMIPYMFSIENLAWKDADQQIFLPDAEKGPNGGRIMWFPPYGLNFSESNAVSWDSTNFIGRGEPIYTYNHSERSGSLDFMIVVDHPSVLNQIRKDFASKFTDPDGLYHSFFAGCNTEDLKDIFKSYLTKDDELSDTNIGFKPDTTPYTTEPIKPTEPSTSFDEIRIYFENCENSSSAEGRYFVYDVIDNGYEVINSSLVPVTPLCAGSDGRNKGVIDKINSLVQFLLTPDGKNYKINVIGHTSPYSSNVGYNEKLGLDRANSVYSYLYEQLVLNEPLDGVKLDCGEGCNEYYPTEDSMPYNDRWNVGPDKNIQNIPNTVGCPNTKLPNGACPSGDVCSTTELEEGQANSSKSKDQRYVYIKLEKNLNIQASILKKINDKNRDVFEEEREKKNAIERENKKQQVGTFVTEMDYFMELERSSPFIYESLHEKIQNFHPAFHSMTPEGLNSRLTFLLQCTRQGPQLIDDNKTPQNMVFGRPPICVLRIGDFYHTKIVIDSVNITYEPLQWDLNPEGIGVQPMIAKVNMGFKFIGGSSLGGPIKQLQNAVSYNFFANTSVYRPKIVVEKNIEIKKKVLYGSFITPDEADKSYETVSNYNQTISQTPESSKSATNNDTSTAGAGNQLKTETSTEASKNLDSATQSTDGSDKPPTATPEIQSNSIATVTVTSNNNIQVSIINDEWVITNVTVSTIDNENNTGEFQVLTQSFSDDRTQLSVTSDEIKNGITSSFTDLTKLEGYPNVKCRYNVRVTEKSSENPSDYDGSIIIKF